MKAEHADRTAASGHAAIPFDRYLTYDEMTAHLHALADRFPRLMRLSSIATTHRGRSVWLVELTNPDTGPGSEKPGFYIDAQIHAEEHATSATALYGIWHLLTSYGHDEEATRLLDKQVFYILPRINPDGAEFSLAAPYHPWCGNGRFLPGEDRIEGLIPGDIDGDGFIAQMRVPDPKGEWKRSEADPDLMVQRAPGEEGGTYYRLYPEGRIRNHDGLHVAIERGEDGNMNRNFPINWSPREYGAGAYPLSEPEAMGMGRLILDHPNICGMCAYHTHGGIILRPSMTKLDRDMSPRDLALYKALGAVGTGLTGYPVISTYEEFTPDKSKVRHGSLKDWVYEEMGIICFSTELWDIETAAGATKAGYYNLAPADDETAGRILDWVKRNVGGQGFRPWTAFDHPELGPVEVGGMVNIWAYRNPPGHLLEDICRRNVLFNLRHAAAAPQLRIDALDAEALGAGLYRVTAVVSNHGYLPTNLSDVAIANSVARPVTLTIEGAEVVMNPATADLGHLAGRNERGTTWSPWGEQWSPVTRRAEWLVRGPAKITVTARSQKAGTVRETLALS